ncbi:MAG: adenosine kinase, partial [bacterium]|nr:adenosine kinase [bacterium]
MARKYNVYGIGNALVDIQYQVDPGFIKEAGIEKGVMTLIDEDRHQALIERLGSVAFQRSSGGSAANTMIGVANMGGKAYYACKVANDEFGDFYLRDLKEADVDSIKSNQTDGITGKCLVLITPDADRTMNTFLGITATFGPEQIEPEVIQQSDYLYIEGYLLTGDSGFKAAQVAQEQAQEKGTRVALTLSDPLVVEEFKSRIQELMDRGVDLLFCNEFEAQALTGTSQTAAACSALEKQVEGFAVTCGPDGAVVRGDGR